MELSTLDRIKAKFTSPLTVFLIVVPLTLLLLVLFSGAGTEVTPATFKSCNSPECHLKIPKIIHQTYKTKNLPESWRQTPDEWKRVHPDWTYEFWDDERNRKFIVDEYPWFLKQFDSYPNNIQRADSIRYFILYHYGGVYADMDIQPIRNIETMLGDATTVIPETPNLGLTNAFMASVKNDAFMEHLTHQLESYANRWYHVSRHWQILTSTGPTFIWKVANEYEAEHGQSILRVPASVWGKCVICASMCPALENGYLRHLHGDSWHNWDSWFFTYVLFCHQYTMIMIGVGLVVLIVHRGNTSSWCMANKEIVGSSLLLFCILMLFQGA